MTPPLSNDAATIAAAFRVPIIRAAAAAIAQGNLAEAERLARGVLAQDPPNIPANVILADIASRVGIYREAERRLREVLALAPDYFDATINLALALFPQGRLDEALSLLDRVIARDPTHVRAAASKADMLAQTGEYDAAAATYRALLEQVSDNAEIWLWYGHLLKTIGRQESAVEAYRRATALTPDLGDAWWSLSELKANRVEEADIAAIERAIVRATAADQRLFLHFALGKSFEERTDWARSFAHYAEGNRLRLQLEPHERDAVSNEVDRSIELYTAGFFASRAQWGCPAPDPIFIIGLPRSGSTLIEQILASHTQIEGTAELPDIPLMVQALVAERWQDTTRSYPAVVGQLDRATTATLGERYLTSAARHRKTRAPFFIDKLPNNWRYLGLIRLILPNAKIIDARRGAMACCFSNFKQHFARGQSFAYSLADIGAYYRDYTRAMAHFDATSPGAVHRVEHERLLDDPETEIRRLLDYLELPFEEACLRPHENNRPVRTASSEQVRRPINRDALNQWQHYAPWLDELRTALGDAA